MIRTKHYCYYNLYYIRNTITICIIFKYKQFKLCLYYKLYKKICILKYNVLKLNSIYFYLINLLISIYPVQNLKDNINKITYLIEIRVIFVTFKF